MSRDTQREQGGTRMMPLPLRLFDDAWLDPQPPRAFTPIELEIAGRRLITTPVFDTYWRFAAERQNVYFSRLLGNGGPWSDDPILRRHRFTNAYRAADRVSQFLIRDVLYDGRERSWEDHVFRVLLFKFFNKIETWRALEDAFGEVSLDGYDFKSYASVLDERRERGECIYSAAYVIPQPPMGEHTKHRNHLRLLELMMRSDLPGDLVAADSMSAAYDVMLSYPSIGRFLGFQFLTDLNYATTLGFSEMDFVVAGPGARDGARKCFGVGATGIEEPIIAWMADTQHEHFERLGLPFRSLFGRRLQLIDIQNLFCEVDKYARVAHPDVAGLSGRTRIKQHFTAQLSDPVSPTFPPQWGLSTERPLVMVNRPDSSPELLANV